MNEIVYIVEREIIESKVFLIYKPLWEEILCNGSSMVFCRDIKEKSTIISTIEKNGISINENKIIDNIPNLQFTYLFISESLKKNENIKQVKLNINQDFEELSLKNTDAIISIFSISELTNKPKILKGDFLKKYLYLEPIYNRLQDSENNKLNKFLFIHTNDNTKRKNIVEIVYKLINEVCDEKPRVQTVKDVILNKFKYQEYQKWICDSTCPSINQLLQILALNAGSQIIFLNKYSSCEISRNNYQELSFINDKNISLRSKIKSLFEPKNVISEHHKKTIKYENKSLYYLENIFCYIFNENLEGLQKLFSLDDANIVQNYILNFYQNHFYWKKDKIKKISNIGIFNHNHSRFVKTSGIEDELSILLSLGKSLDYNIRKSLLLNTAPSKSIISELENNNFQRKYTSESLCYKIQSDNSLRFKSIITSLVYNKNNLANMYISLDANDLCTIFYDVIIYDRDNPLTYHIFDKINTIKNELTGVFIVLFGALSTIINKAHVLKDLSLPDISNYPRKTHLMMQTPPWLLSCLLLTHFCDDDNYARFFLEKIKSYPLDYQIYLSVKKHSNNNNDLDLREIKIFLKMFACHVYNFVKS